MLVFSCLTEGESGSSGESLGWACHRFAFCFVWHTGRGYLFGCVQQWGRRSCARLLDHLVEEPILVLEQHIRLVILLDPASSQNLQSRTRTFTTLHVHVSATCILCFGENWHFSCLAAEWSMQTVRDEWRNSSSLHTGTIHFMWVMQQQTQAPVSAQQGLRTMSVAR